MAQPLTLADYDYDLPPELIAQEPARPRDSSRLLVLERSTGAVRHQRFTDLPQLLSPGDLLVVNRTRVIPARLMARKPTGGKVELLAIRAVDAAPQVATRWIVLGKPGKALQPGAVLMGPGETPLTVESRQGAEAVVSAPQSWWDMLHAHGRLPLPPYIREGQAATQDAQDYQTLFAEEPGAVAAPTASLHFTPRVVEQLHGAGVTLAPVVLHVGPGTFLPVRPEHAADVRQHTMHAESYHIPEATAAAIRATKARGQRVIAVGTTVVRTLEAWHHSGALQGDTNLFIYPGYAFGVVDALVTNFHLPKSTLLMLVSAFAGHGAIMGAYSAAIAQRYRFFSYGDAMLIADVAPREPPG